MSPVKKAFSLSISGALIGALLGMAAPPKTVTASETCKCDDFDVGNYKCNYAQDDCDKGGEICHLKCQD